MKFVIWIAFIVLELIFLYLEEIDVVMYLRCLLWSAISFIISNHKIDFALILSFSVIFLNVKFRLNFYETSVH